MKNGKFALRYSSLENVRTKSRTLRASQVYNKMLKKVKIENPKK